MSAIRKTHEPQVNFGTRPISSADVVSAPTEITPFGQTLVLNILGGGPKACTFDCPYCDLGRTFIRLNRLKQETPFPETLSINEIITKALVKIHTSGPSIDSLLFSGNGEPTLHPEFHDVVAAVVEARDIWLTGKAIRVLTNGSMLDNRKISDALNTLDEVIVKIDSGNEKTFKLANAPLSRTTVARVITGAKKIRNLSIQSMFFQGAIDNTSNSDIDDWIEVIAIMQPKNVYIQGLSRQPASSDLIRCEEDVLYGIASKLERKTQIKAIVMP